MDDSAKNTTILIEVSEERPKEGGDEPIRPFLVKIRGNSFVLSFIASNLEVAVFTPDVLRA